MGGGNHLLSPRREAGRRGALWSGVGEGGSHVGCAARGASSVAPPPPLPTGRGGGWGEGRQDGGGEVGRAGRRCCRRHRRLRSGRLWFFKLSPPRRSCSGVASRGESKSLPQPSSASTLALPDSLPLPPSSGGRVGPGWGGRHLTPVWGLPGRPLICATRGPRGAWSRRWPRSARFLRPSAPGPAVAARGTFGPRGLRCPRQEAPALGGEAGSADAGSASVAPPPPPPRYFPRSTPALRGPGRAGK